MVNIEPMPLTYREIPRRWRPEHPPVFPDGDPSPADIELARELYLALDDESQAWYHGLRPLLGLAPLARGAA